MRRREATRMGGPMCVTVTEMPSVVGLFGSAQTSVRNDMLTIPVPVKAPRRSLTKDIPVLGRPEGQGALLGWSVVVRMQRFGDSAYGFVGACAVGNGRVGSFVAGWTPAFFEDVRIRNEVLRHRIKPRHGGLASPSLNVAHDLLAIPTDPPNPLIGICVSPILSTGSGDGAAQ